MSDNKKNTGIMNSQSAHSWTDRDYVGSCKKCEVCFTGHKRDYLCRTCYEAGLVERIDDLKHEIVSLKELLARRNQTILKLADELT